MGVCLTLVVSIAAELLEVKQHDQSIFACQQQPLGYMYIDCHRDYTTLSVLVAWTLGAVLHAHPVTSSREACHTPVSLGTGSTGLHSSP